MKYCVMLEDRTWSNETVEVTYSEMEIDKVGWVTPKNEFLIFEDEEGKTIKMLPVHRVHLVERI